MFKNKKVLWIILVAAVVITAGVYGIYTWTSPEETEAEETAEVQTAVAREGDLVVSASGSGLCGGRGLFYHKRVGFP